MSDTSYKKVLVLGSKKVGKTSLLTALTSREFDDEYHRTKKVLRFWDVKRRLEFIDTPGLDDKILELIPNSSEQSLKTEEDPEFIRVLNVHDTEDLDSISAFVIVYSQANNITKHMAYQLKDVLSLHSKNSEGQKAKKMAKPIWIVENQGNILRVQEVDREELKDRKFSDCNLAKVNVKTSKGVEELFDEIAKHDLVSSKCELHTLFPDSAERIKSSGGMRATCQAPGCSVM